MHKAIKIALLVIGTILVLWLINSIIIPKSWQYFSENHLKQVYSSQASLLNGPIASLGVKGMPGKHFQCDSKQVLNHWQTQVICIDAETYPYNAQTKTLSVAAKANYPAHAKKLEDLLTSNGWVHASTVNYPAKLTSINPSTFKETSNSTQIEVPFNKTMGSISCNLQIDYFGTSYSKPQGFLFVNEFSCTDAITYPEFHLSVPQPIVPV